jgi:hypothetical protein
MVEITNTATPDNAAEYQEYTEKGAFGKANAQAQKAIVAADISQRGQARNASGNGFSAALTFAPKTSQTTTGVAIRKAQKAIHSPGVTLPGW